MNVTETVPTGGSIIITLEAKEGSMKHTYTNFTLKLELNEKHFFYFYTSTIIKSNDQRNKQ